MTSGSITKIKIGNNLYDINIEGKALAGIDVDGELDGNAIANIEYDDNTNRLKVTKTHVTTTEELSILEQNVVSKDLSTLSILSDNYDKDNAYIYVYDSYNKTSNKISISKIVDTKIRTVETAPSDWKINEYIFEEVK